MKPFVRILNQGIFFERDNVNIDVLNELYKSQYGKTWAHKVDVSFNSDRLIKDVKIISEPIGYSWLLPNDILNSDEDTPIFATYSFKSVKLGNPLSKSSFLSNMSHWDLKQYFKNDLRNASFNGEIFINDVRNLIYERGFILKKCRNFKKE